ncbi:hypothetical protein LUZ60_003554 [Juncus effusus]|nr:hypothetical protein LUZ60_003554 [Juncus effusus]
MQSLILIKPLSFLFLLSLLIHPSVASPPQDPVHCTKTGSSDCIFSNAYGAFPDRSTCHASEVVYPSSEEELKRVVADATALKQKMKVVTRFAHSIPKLACSGGSDGILISTRYLNNVISVDKTKMQITVESGITLKDLIEVAAEAGLALTHAPYWSGLTIGGLLSTGAHGSSLWGKGSAVHEYVVGMRLVTPAPDTQGFVTIRVLKMDDPDLDAAKVSLGVLGAISQVTLQLEPMFKRSITFSLKDDSDLVELAGTFAYQHEFADILWYPGHRKALYRLDDRMPVNVSGEGMYDFIGFRSTPTSAILSNRLTEETLETTKNAKGKCGDSQAATSAFSLIGYGLTNNGPLFTGYPVIGYQNKMQSASSCAFGAEDFLATACPWDPRIKGTFFYQTGVSVPLDRVGEFVSDFQKLRDLNPDASCGLELYDGVLVRYVKASSAYLGKQCDSVDFELTYYRSRDASKPRLHEDFIEEIEQMALFKYNGSPHWGKNRNVAFEDVIKNYMSGQDFIRVKEQYDPDGLFSSEWSDQVLGLQGSVVELKEGCALEGLCVCQDDSHCAPDKGYYCKPGKVYTDARVCSYVGY